MKSAVSSNSAAIPLSFSARDSALRDTVITLFAQGKNTPVRNYLLTVPQLSCKRWRRFDCALDLGQLTGVRFQPGTCRSIAQFHGCLRGCNWPDADRQCAHVPEQHLLVRRTTPDPITEIVTSIFRVGVQGILFFNAGYTFADLRNYFHVTSSLPPGITTPT